MPAALQASNSHVEFINGHEIPKPLPKRLHWIVQARLFRELLRWESTLNIDIGTEVDILAGSSSTERLIPDVAAIPRNSQYRDGILVSGALLAVEIMSPGQTIGQLFDKCEMLHAGGTRDCWVLWPQKRAAWEYPAGSLPTQAMEMLRAGEIEISLPSLFRDLPDDPE
jgi:hypothetical protein